MDNLYYFLSGLFIGLVAGSQAAWWAARKLRRDLKTFHEQDRKHEEEDKEDGTGIWLPIMSFDDPE